MKVIILILLFVVSCFGAAQNKPFQVNILPVKQYKDPSVLDEDYDDYDETTKLESSSVPTINHEQTTLKAVEDDVKDQVPTIPTETDQPTDTLLGVLSETYSKIKKIILGSFGWA